MNYGKNVLLEAQVGKIATNASKAARQQIMERWDNLHFLDGLNGYLKDNMATIFENEANVILNEATDAQNSGSFETVVFPLVRRVFSRLLANDIVSVQAMNMPIGRLFFILPVTSDRRKVEEESGETYESHYGLMGYERDERNANGAKRNRYYLPDEVVGDVIYSDGKIGKPETTQYIKKSLYDLYYNDGLFDNSKGRKHINLAKHDDIKIVEFAKNNSGDFTDANVAVSGLDNTVRNVILEVGGFSGYRAGKLTGPDGNEMDTEAFLATLKVTLPNGIEAKPRTDLGEGAKTTEFTKGEDVHFRCVTQRYGKGLVEYSDVCDAQGKIYIELDFTKPTIKPGMTIDGYIGVDKSAFESGQTADMFNVSWAQYDSLELETEIGEVSFQLSDVTVSVEERKLRATWSPEMAQDVAAFHNIDAEAELTAILSEQIAAEIDREILRDLRKVAPWQLKWDYNGWRRQQGFSTNYTQKDWNQTFMTKINQISAQIHKATLRGGANFVVVSTEISAMLNDLEYFHVSDASAEQISYSLGIEKVGSLQGRYTVYVDPYSPSDSCILGHKGDSLLDTGYIYAPYVPMQLTPTIYNAANFAPVKGIITRYAKKMVNNRYYGAIVCNGLQTWDIAEFR